MSKTDKKVSISLFDKISKENFQNEITAQWHNTELKIKKTLPLPDVLAFVNDVVESCFHEQCGFLPEIKDFVIKTNILSRYANFSMPNNLEHRYQMVYCSDAVDTVREFIDTEQLREIVDAINTKIQFRCNTAVTDLQKRIDQVVGTVEKMSNQIGTLFSGVTQDDMRNLIGVISDGGLDEQKLVKAYIDQKTKNDKGSENIPADATENIES